MHTFKKYIFIKYSYSSDIKFTFASTILRYYAESPCAHTAWNSFLFLYVSFPHRGLHLSSWVLMFFHSDSAVHLLLFSRLSLSWHRAKWHIILHYTEHLTTKHSQEILPGNARSSVVSHLLDSYSSVMEVTNDHFMPQPFISLYILLYWRFLSTVQEKHSWG